MWIIAGQALALSGALIGIRLLTELLAPAEYGNLALGMTIATLANQFVLGPLGNAVTRFYAPSIEAGDLGGYLRTVRRMTATASGIIGILLACSIAGLLAAGYGEWVGIVTAALVFAILSGSNAIIGSMQVAARRRSIVAFHQGLDAWLRPLVAAGLIVWLGATGAVAMWGFLFGTLLLLGSQFWFFSRSLPDQLVASNQQHAWQRKMWELSWPIATFGAFTALQLASDRWALALFSTSVDVGLYAVLSQLGNYPISLVAGMASQFLAPILFQRAGDATDRVRNQGVSILSWRLTMVTLGVTVIAFCTALMFHREMFRIFVAPEYASVSDSLPWMLLAAGIFSAGQVIALNLISQMNTRVMMFPKIVTALMGILFNMMGAYWYGAKGVVFASLLFSITFFLWMAVLSSRQGAEN